MATSGHSRSARRNPESLLPEVYDGLRRLARRFLANERPDHSLQPTALVHEAWVRLARNRNGFRDRRHFHNLAARAMRRILVNHARNRARLKRGGERQRVTLDGREPATDGAAIDVLGLDEALRKLARIDDRKRRLVELRYFAGLELTEVATALGVSLATVKREWVIARAWLARELARDPAEPDEI